MSNTAPMTKEAGSQYLFENVQAPVFFNRLQQVWGISPGSPAEQALMLKTAAQLIAAKELEVQQQQVAGQTLLQKAAAHLDQHLQTAYPQAFDPLPQLIAATAKQAAANPQIIEACRALNRT